jgi:hypothetical protein
MARVTGSGPEELKSLAVRLKEADPRLRLELRRSMRKSAAPVVREVQRSILDMPSVHGSPPGRVPLREAIARTVTASVSTTASGVKLEIVSLGRRMPEGEQNLPALADRQRGWGHPVWGRHTQTRKEWTWVRQHGKTGWFERPVIDSARQVQDELQAALDETARKLGG